MKRSNLLFKEKAMKHLMKIRTLILSLFMLVGTMPAFAVERPFALNGTGVVTLITDGSGHLLGAVPTGSGTATPRSVDSHR